MSTVSSYWCEMAWLGGPAVAEAVLVRADNGRITEVTPDTLCPPKAVRLAGLTLPGLANVHSHAFQRALRGRTQVGTGSFWTWREQMYDLAARLDPEDYHRLARAVFGEMAMAGITCVGEFHYLHHGPGGVPYADPLAMSEAIVAAASEAGIRLTLLDTCYLHGGIGVEPSEVQRRFSDGDAGRWAARAAQSASRFSGPLVRVGAAVHSVRAVDKRAVGAVGAWAERHGAPLHAHVSEQRAENEQCIAAYHQTPTGLFAEHGLLNERFTAVHATHLSVDDIGQLGEGGCTIGLCPTTERDLADGIGPASALRSAGASLALGSDSHAVIDLFEEARAVELDERLASNVRGHHPAVSLLWAATVSGHRSLGWGDAGLIAVGAAADLVSVRLDTVRTAGTQPAFAVEAAVYAATAGDVHHVVVGGEVVVRDGRHVRFDVARELAGVVAEVLA
jgi:formiminoglutamate deiminase